MATNLYIPHPDERLSIIEACERYKVDRSVIIAAVKRGDVRAWKPGKQYQIDKGTADKWFLASEMRGRR